MAHLGPCLAIVFCLLAEASGFPFTYPRAFPFGNPIAAVDRTTPDAPPFMSTPPSPPTSTQGGQGKGGAEVGASGGKVWCIAKPAADEQTLLANIAYACEEGGIDCASIQPGGSCFTPRSIISHASFVMNMYYQMNQRNWWTCHFNNTGLVVFADPSYGECVYSPQ